MHRDNETVLAQKRTSMQVDVDVVYRDATQAPKQQPSKDNRSTSVNKSLCQLALENPHDKELHKILAYAYRTAYDKREVLQLPEFKALGVTSVIDTNTHYDYHTELNRTIVEVFIRLAGLPGIDM